MGRSSGCASSTVGNGLPDWSDRGNGGGGSSTGGAGAGVTERSSVGVMFLFLAAASVREAARAGSFLFLSIAMLARRDGEQGGESDEKREMRRPASIVW